MRHKHKKREINLPLFDSTNSESSGCRVKPFIFSQPIPVCEQNMVDHTIVHFDIPAKDVEKLKKFYSVNWKIYRALDP